tara:strand:- start:228 stop:752 length:525 start_codon:yes stop_codon:yes gene_type:complete
MLGLFSCKKIDDNGFKVYKIKEGKHRSTFKHKTSYAESFDLEVIFDENASYETSDPNNQLDVNKLWGVSDCGTNHSYSSIRFGWRWNLENEAMEILMYRRMFGEFDFKSLGFVNLGETNYLSMNITSDSYEMCLNGHCDSMERPCSITYKRYFLYPYFGGDECAPHNITIRIKE